jgi:cellulose synthase/poly-beta-1,6-N-acetylglucosamine synthase-like glycosyltransferase
MLQTLMLVTLIGINLVALPYFLFLLVISIGALASRRHPELPETATSRFLIVVPAHNEESGIAQTVRSCRALDYPETLFELVVIADNCDDQTAEVARQAGAQVIERLDSEKKSKGYALEFLFDQLLEKGRFEDLSAIVVIDADSTADPNLLQQFDRALRAGADWLQCYYTVANAESSWRTQLMTFAFSLINGVSPLGQNAVGLSAGFRGNGMAFSTRGLRRCPFRTYGLVEDIEYSWDLRIAGEFIRFVPHTRVYGQMVSGGGTAAANQRRRWEFGRSELRRKKLGPLLQTPYLGLLSRVGSAIELTMPPMVRLLAGFAGLSILNLVALAFTAAAEQAKFEVATSEGRLITLRIWEQGLGSGGTALVAFQVIMVLAVSLYALSPFLALGLPWRYAAALIRLPSYALWKIGAARGGKPQTWIRTAREP